MAAQIEVHDVGEAGVAGKLAVRMPMWWRGRVRSAVCREAGPDAGSPYHEALVLFHNQLERGQVESRDHEGRRGGLAGGRLEKSNHGWTRMNTDGPGGSTEARPTRFAASVPTGVRPRSRRWSHPFSGVSRSALRRGVVASEQVELGHIVGAECSMAVSGIAGL